MVLSCLDGIDTDARSHLISKSSAIAKTISAITTLPPDDHGSLTYVSSDKVAEPLPDSHERYTCSIFSPSSEVHQHKRSVDPNLSFRPLLSSCLNVRYDGMQDIKKVVHGVFS